MRQKTSFTVPDIRVFKEKLQDWAQQFNEVVWLDGNGTAESHSSFDCILAVDALTVLVTDTSNAFEDLTIYRSSTKDWIFGYLSYDLKNDIEALHSRNFDGLDFSDLYFFQPKKIICINNNVVEFIYLNMVDDEMDGDFADISSYERNGTVYVEPSDIRIKMRIFKDEYFKQVERLLQHIHRGDVYEANFCQEFYAEDTVIDPIAVYKKLNHISKAPFACFLKTGEKYLLSASPERYLKREGDTVISQPIKGTAKRSGNIQKDEALKTALSQDPKERAENTMIVDLVRNDLSKKALKGSVEVTEFCKVYSFPQVHQMISTIKAQFPKDIDPVEIIKDSFPMGSMTGAPKISAMKIIEELEATKRGLYSGAVGYFSPEGDFDFNVVIRSILYNANKKYVSFSVGSAITSLALPHKEYEECLLKARAMREVLENKQP